MSNYSKLTNVLIFIVIYSLISFNAAAQIIIPDPYLAEAIQLEGLDTNNDGQLQQSEADELLYLTLSNVPFSSLEGLEYFRNLEELSISVNANIDTIDVLKYQSLEKLSLSWLDNLISLNINGHSNLEDLYLGTLSKIKTIELENIVALEKLRVDNDSLKIFNLDLNNLEWLRLGFGPNLEFVDLSKLSNLEFLHLGSSNDELVEVEYGTLPKLNELKYGLRNGNTLNFKNFPVLKSIVYFFDYHSSLDSIIIEDHDFLEKIDIETYTATTVRFKNLKSLEDLYFDVSFMVQNLELDSLPSLKSTEFNGMSSLRNIKMTNLESIETLSFGISSTSSNDIRSLTLKDLPNLDRLNVSAHRTKTLDLTTLGSLNNLDIHANSLEYLYIKNGSDEELNCIDCNDLIYICADESDTFDLIPDEVFIGSFCPFTSEGAAFEITGNIIYDYGENDCASNTLPMPYVNLKLDKDGVDVGGASSNAVGLYGVFMNDDSLILSPADNSFNSIFHFEPDSISVDTTRRTTTQNICVQPKELTCEFELFITSMGAPRPGETTDYKIFVRNIGTVVPEGTVSLLFPDDLIEREEVSINPDEMGEGNLTWNLPTLLPFEKFEIDVSFQLNTPTDAMPLNDGDTLRLDLVLDASNDNEQKVFSNHLTEVIVNSFDPNDKTCLQGPEIEQEDLGEFLFYRIRLENVGSADALNVIVEDTIDASVFELNTFQVVDASHEVKTKIRGSNISFIFEDINLGFEDDVNDGFVVFKILPKGGLKVGQHIDNEASIYFDYNFPIHTNVARTTIIENIILDIGGVQSAEKLNIYPSISDSYVSFDGLQDEDEIQIFNLQGIKFYDFEIHSGNTMEISNLKKGIYFVQIQREDVRYIGRFIKM